MLNYFKKRKMLRRKKSIALSIENSKTLNNHTFLKKTVLSVICSKCKNEDENIFKEEKSIEILKKFE